jgi:hypothetical protein
MAEQAKLTAAATAAAKAVAKKEAKLRVEIGKQPTTVDEWVRAKTKMPNLFTFTEDGNLVSPPFAPGETEKIIYLPPEERTSTDELKEYFATRATELKEPEEMYAAAKRRLREIIDAYKSGQQTVHDVIQANNDVHEAECILNAKAKGARHIQTYKALMERELTMNIYDTRTFPLNTYVMEYSVFPWGPFWKKATERADVVGPVAVEEIAVAAAAPTSAAASTRDPEAARTGAIIARRIAKRPKA